MSMKGLAETLNLVHVATALFTSFMHLLKIIYIGCLEFRHQPIMLIFSPIMLCCSAQNLTYYAQYYAHVCLKFDCSIRVYSQNY